MPNFRLISLGFAALISLSPVSALAANAVVDAYDDFLPSYTAGPANGDLDVIAAAAFYDGADQRFSFSTILADKVGLTAGALYVWGIDRGRGTERFLAGSPAIGAGVLFDSVLIVRPNGTGLYNDFINAVVTNLDPANIKIGSLTVTLEDLPLGLFAPGTTGFRSDPSQYTWNLWPRVGLGSNNQISDFAPDAANLGFQVTAVPEPETWAMLLAGLGLVGLQAARTRRHAQALGDSLT
ncbi:MAG: PEPxxWA-CTERM sorting domain-containing protein [Pseudomonadota bacterium]|nr:PEPxxWA-CTERM sorting domain-containing protein [Pseudomonadota bacterium]